MSFTLRAIWPMAPICKSWFTGISFLNSSLSRRMPSHRRSCSATLHARLLQDVRDVIFDRVETDALPLRNLPVALAMADGVDHAPLGGSQDIVMGGTAAL